MVTPEEAIKIINQEMMITPDRYNGKTVLENLVREAAVKALEKQVKKKLVRGFDEEMLCAGCSAFICFAHNTKSEMYQQAKYCEFCGQAIDWSE